MKISLEFIVETTARQFATTPEKIRGRDRRRPVFRARQAAMYVARTVGARSFPAIARYFNGRDHTSVISAVRQVPDLIARNPDYKKRVLAIIDAAVAEHDRQAEAARGGVFRHHPNRIKSDSRTKTPTHTP